MMLSPTQKFPFTYLLVYWNTSWHIAHKPGHYLLTENHNDTQLSNKTSTQVHVHDSSRLSLIWMGLNIHSCLC